MRMRWLRRNECQLGKNRQCLLCERAIFTMKAFTLRHIAPTDILQYSQCIVEKGGLSRPPGRHF